jgi:hypothetical protein
MKRIKILTLVACVALLAACGLPAQAQQTTPTNVSGVPQIDVSDLLSDLEFWNGRRIAISGELVGDYSYRSDGVWVQINDDPYVRSPIGAGGKPVGANIGIGARVPRNLFDQGVVGPPGREGRFGPVVRAVGVFHHNDPALTGETYLQVEEITTLEPAESYPEPGADLWTVVGVVLIGAAAAVALTTRYKRRAEPA